MKSNVIGLFLLILSFSFIPYVKLSGSKSEKDIFVPNKETAVKVAEAIWLPIYSQTIYQDTPFVARLKNANVWIVEGTLHTDKGGVPYIEIRKSDCKILKVMHGR